MRDLDKHVAPTQRARFLEQLQWSRKYLDRYMDDTSEPTSGADAAPALAVTERALSSVAEGEEEGGEERGGRVRQGGEEMADGLGDTTESDAGGEGMEDSGEKRVDKDVDIEDEDLVVDAFAPTFSREKRKHAKVSSELAPERRGEGGEAAGDLGGDVAAGGDGQQGGGEEREDGSEHENGGGHEDDDEEVIITGESVDEAVAAQHKERAREGTREEPAAVPLTREELDKIRALGGQKFWKMSVRT
jgi:hypothetical protein